MVTIEPYKLLGVSVNLWQISFHLFQLLIPVCCALWLRENSTVVAWVTTTCFHMLPLDNTQIFLDHLTLKWHPRIRCFCACVVSIPSRCIPKISSCHPNSCSNASAWINLLVLTPGLLFQIPKNHSKVEFFFKNLPVFNVCSKDLCGLWLFHL